MFPKVTLISYGTKLSPYFAQTMYSGPGPYVSGP